MCGAHVFETVEKICAPIKACVDMGVEIGVVVGGGNFWRGRSSGKMNRARADSMGMLATTINAIAIQDTFIKSGIDTVVMTSVDFGILK